MNAFGMPGPGGSLGQCALCGENFITEVLLGTTVVSIAVEGCSQQLFAHHKCVPLYQGKDMTDLPAASPLRQAYERQQQSG